MGLSRLGLVAYLTSRPVILGFTTGATILIAASQIPTLFGLELRDSGLLSEAWKTLTARSQWDLVALAYGLGTMLVIEVSRRFGQRVPGVLIAAGLALIVSGATGFDGPTVGEIPSGFFAFDMSQPWSSWASLVVPALVISLVGFTEAAAIASVYAAEDRARWDQEPGLRGSWIEAWAAASLATGTRGGEQLT